MMTSTTEEKIYLFELNDSGLLRIKELHAAQEEENKHWLCAFLQLALANTDANSYSKKKNKPSRHVWSNDQKAGLL